mgnify:CR=1 FL=1
MNRICLIASFQNIIMANIVQTLTNIASNKSWDKITQFLVVIVTALTVTLVASLSFNRLKTTIIKEVNIYLRGMVPLVGFKSTSVYYERHERYAGESHYPLSKMLSLAFDGITSLSIKPIRMIMGLGMFIAILSFVGVIWSFVVRLSGNAVSGWASMTCLICFLGGIQLICLGVLGEYIGKIYMETKERPRYIISETTMDQEYTA